MSNLNTFPIPLNELNEILYDYLDPKVKPSFSIIFYTETFNKEKYDIIKVTCLKCCDIIKNPEFTRLQDTPKGYTQRQFVKKINTINLFNTPIIKDEISKATYFERKDNNNIIKGHYDFPQLSKKQQYTVANVIFKENIADIPNNFVLCANGEC